MRLVELKSDGELGLIKDRYGDLPDYAILSHTWAEDEDDEFSFEDLKNNQGRTKPAYKKIQFCAKQTARDDLRHFWVDTCCIDQSNNVELTEAINSMFQWYSGAKKCYVYLTDVSSVSSRGSSSDAEIAEEDWMAAFERSRWFTRAWTLQELIAPSVVEFFSVEGKLLGSKESLEQSISNITGIGTSVFRGRSLTEFSFQERMSWAKNRTARKDEDVIYSLLGIFGIHMSLIYGEGRQNALDRLQRKMNRLPARSKGLVSTMPFERDVHFVGREKIMDEIENRLSQSRSIAIAGIGGVGKSQIAIEYSYRFQAQFNNSSVFWVHASNALRFQEAYMSVARKLGLLGLDDPKTNVLQLVHDWLSDEAHGMWLMILDNVDDMETILPSAQNNTAASGSPRPLMTYIPKCATGKILITTRDARVGERLSDQRKSIMVPPFATNEAVELLKSKLPEYAQFNETEAVDLVETLGNIPLAITQAASFIQENHCTLSEYGAALHASSVDQMKLMDEELFDPRRDIEAANSVSKTLRMTFESIERRIPRATDMLSLAACLEGQGIPKQLLRKTSDTHIDFMKALGTLLSFSIISTDSGGELFMMHRLVQLFVRGLLEDRNTSTVFEAEAVEAVSNAFPAADQDISNYSAILLPHALRVAEYSYTSETNLLFLATLQHNLAWYQRERGHNQAAFDTINAAMGIRKKILGDSSVPYLHSLSVFGGVQQLQGRYVDAEAKQRHAMNGLVAAVGKEHHLSLESMDMLGEVLQSSGKYKEAEALSRTTLDIRQRILGQDNLYTIDSTAMLSSALAGQGKYFDAEVLSRRSLKGYEELLGHEHKRTLECMHNLAWICQQRGRLKEAEELQMDVIEISKRTLGAEHRNTLVSLNDLALALKRQGRLEEAYELNTQVLQTSKRVLGAEHPDTIMNLSNLAFTIKAQGRHRDAITLMQQCLELRTKILGPDHPDTGNASEALSQWEAEGHE